MRHKNSKFKVQNSIPEGMVRLIKTQLSHAIVNLQVHKSNSSTWNFSLHEQNLDLWVQMTWFLTISHDRGWKPTVKPSNTRTPCSLHGMESSTRTLDSKQLEITTHLEKVETSTYNHWELYMPKWQYLVNIAK